MIFFRGVAISLERVIVTSPKIVINFPRTFSRRSYPVMENPIGSAVSEILRYKQTDILLLYYKDFVEIDKIPKQSMKI